MPAKLSLDPETEEVLKWVFRGKIKPRCGSLEKAHLSLFYRYRPVKPGYAREYPALKVSCHGKSFVIHVSQSVMSDLPYLRRAYRLKKLTENLEEVLRKLRSLDLSVQDDVLEQATRLYKVLKELETEKKRVERLLRDALKSQTLSTSVKVQVEEVLKSTTSSG